ncbi:MAG: hypothetical protein ACFFAB_14780 [Candidatus Heimdallarchaeota archaeon]
MSEKEMICENCGENTSEEIYECVDCLSPLCDECANICRECGEYLCDGCYNDHSKKCD